MSKFVVAALYKFADLDDYRDLHEPLRVFCEAQGLRGTLLLAAEGINGTVSGTREAIDALLARLRSDPRLADLEHKESFHDALPFRRMKVRLKKEIVTLGRPEANPNVLVGAYVAPEDWNALIADPDTIVLDTRNDYEVDVGSFERAINPTTATFREFPQFVETNLKAYQDKKIAMFCTGGIRCEKASALMLTMGFREVYHLKGGILKYLEEIPPEQSLWRGECFVFDERVTIGHGLDVGDYHLCRGCRYPITPEDMASPKYENGVSCPHCYDTTSEEQRARFRMRQSQAERAKARAAVAASGAHQSL